MIYNNITYSHKVAAVRVLKYDVLYNTVVWHTTYPTCYVYFITTNVLLTDLPLHAATYHERHRLHYSE
jgi:hypothetical protein